MKKLLQTIFMIDLKQFSFKNKPDIYIKALVKLYN